MAFRRRFEFVEVLPNPSLLGRLTSEQGEVDLAKLLIALNQKIEPILGKDSLLGDSFLMDVTSMERLASRFRQSIIPQVAQACMNNVEVLQQIFGENIIQLASANPRGYGQARGFVVSERALDLVESYQEIYE